MTMPFTFTRCQWICLIAMILIIGIPICMLLDRRAPIELTHGEIIPHQVRNGGKAKVVWTAIERRACDGEYTRIVVSALDGARQHHVFGVKEQTVYQNTMEPGRRKFSRDVDFPTGMAAGPALYTTSGVRWCNVFQKYLWPIPFKGLEIPFEVLPDDASLPRPRYVAREFSEPNDMSSSLRQH